MAFAQQQRRPVQRLQPYSDDSILHQQPSTISDSDNDWHIISSTLSPSTTSSIGILSETESCCSSSFKPTFSDTDSDDIDHIIEATLNIPSHDGTGTFGRTASTTSNSSISEDEDTAVMPPFLPTTSGIRSQELIEKGTYHEKKSSSPLYMSKNLDSIPIHHPAGTAAILSIVWNSLRRITNHIIENETNTMDTLSSLMSEAMLEGYLPFGSHLHMDKSLLEVE